MEAIGNLELVKNEAEFKKKLEQKAKGLYVRILKMRIIAVEAGKCQRCLIGKVDLIEGLGCENCKNEIFKKLIPINPPPTKFRGFEEEIKLQLRARIRSVASKRPDIFSVKEIKKEEGKNEK